MYSRAIRSLYVISSNILLKSETTVRSFNPASILSKVTNVKQPCFITAVRPCTTPILPNKDEVATEKLTEYCKNPQNKRNYDIIQMEVEVLRQGGENVPEEIQPRHWLELVRLSSRAQRRKYVQFLFVTEKKNENLLMKKKIKNEMRQKEIQEAEDPNVPRFMRYHLCANSFFLRFYEITMNRLYHWNIMRALMDDHKLILDCGYEDQMTRKEMKNCSKQLMLAFAENRIQDEPFYLELYNLNPAGDLHNELHNFIPTMYDADWPMSVSPKSYLDVYDRKNLVYLTPDCTNDLEYDPDCKYIVGALVDKVSGKPLSKAKAKREGIRMAKLPLDKYLEFGISANRSLTINQMITILAEFDKTKDWATAFKHVPMRKLRIFRERLMEQKAMNYLQKSERMSYQSQSPQDFSIYARKKLKSQ